MMMKRLPLLVGVRMQLIKHDANNRVRSLVGDERGEMGSWLIVAAGLAIAAAAVVGILSPWFEEKAGEITDN